MKKTRVSVLFFQVLCMSHSIFADSSSKKVNLTHFKSSRTTEYLGWDILDQKYFGGIRSYKIIWSFRKNSCPTDKIFEDEKLISSHQHSDEFNLEPYSRYNISLYIYGTKHNLLERFSDSEIETTESSGDLKKEEMPSIKKVETGTTNATVYFNGCEKLRGTAFVLYEASSQSQCCKKINANNSVKFIPDNYPLVINDLTPYCNYTIRLTLSRRKSDWNKAITLPDQSALTKAFDSNNSNELPTIRSITRGTTNVTVYFSIKCATRPLFLKYYVASTKNGKKWCERNFTPLDHKMIPLNNSFNIYNLAPFCEYQLTIEVFTREDGKNGKRLREEIFETNALLIRRKVKELIVTSKDQYYIHLRWLPNDYPPTGVLKEHRIKVNHTGGPPSDLTIGTGKCNIWPQHYCHSLKAKNPNTNHTVRIYAINEYGNLTVDIEKETNDVSELYYAKIDVYTMETKPDPPYNVKLDWGPKFLMKVSWSHPNKTNGDVIQFKTCLNIEFFDNQMTKIQKLFPINRTSYEFRYNQNITDSLAQSKPINAIKLSVFTENIVGLSAPQPSDDTPPPLPKEYKQELKFKNRTLIVPKPEFDPFFAEFYVFLGESKEEMETVHGQIKKNKYTYNKHNIYFYKRNKGDTFNTSDAHIPGMIRIGEYKIALFVVNKLGIIRKVIKTIKLVNKASEYRDDETTDIGGVHIVLGTGLSLLILSILGIFLFRYRHKIFLPSTTLGNAFARYSNAADRSLLTMNMHLNESGEHIYDETVNTLHSKRVKIEDLRNYIKSAVESRELLRQHELFPRADVLMLQDPSITSVYGSLPQNKAKNRYNNIVAFDHTRVKLEKIPGDDFSDYINANYINGYKTSKAYIAAQGPKPNTKNDFWSMIWENHVKYIVMLTNLYDGDKKDCEQYWPEEDDNLNFNGLKVKLASVLTYRTYNLRGFTVNLGGSIRKVYQLHFKEWPSHGRPLFPHTLVPFLQKMLTFPVTSKSPILVHCSAGIGRTGIIILCDMCLRMAAAEGAVDILGMLERLRFQRPNMVDNIEQYKLAHLAILAVLTGHTTNIPCDANFECTVSNILKANDQVPIQMAYIKENEWQDDAMKTVASVVQRHVPIVQEKNRYSDILPDEICQVFLQQLPNQNSGSSYINAIWINSFHLVERYIVTQHPLPNTLPDFWRMVLEQQCTVIVNLSQIDVTEQTSIPFSPEPHTRLNIGNNMHIDHLKTVKDKEISIQTLRAFYTPNDFEQIVLTVQILNFNGWRNNRITPESLDDFVSFVVDSSSIGKKARPIIVTCHDGVTASGVFVALSNVIEEMQAEKVCDVCQHVRSLRVCRKQFVNNDIQLAMMYAAAMIYSRNFAVYNELEN